MRSRYSAYALSLPSYIIASTHPQNKAFMTNTALCKLELDEYSKNETFLGLRIIETIEGDERSFVTFCATLGSGSFTEKSEFEKINGVWLYRSGEFL